MPAKSKVQFKLMKGICEGNYPSGYRGISKSVACEFVNHQSPKGLPERKRKILKKAVKKAAKKVVKKVAKKKKTAKKAVKKVARKAKK